MADERAPSVRGLIDSDIGPLRRFTGILASMPRESKVYNEGQKDERTSQIISLNFSDIEVIESVEPYHFPIFTITLTESNRKKSKYGVVGMSLINILDQQYTPEQLDPNSAEYIRPSDRMDWKDCIGKRLGMVMADGEDGRPQKHELFDGRAIDEQHPKGQDMPTAAWEVYMVEGVGMAGGSGATPMETAMELLNGKTYAAFQKAAMTNEVIKSDVELMASIGMPVSAAKNFGNTMVTSGQFTKDATTGVFTRSV